ncbi:conserved hypothetical protein [Nitrosococcus halophilus Nc 4]|uniref:Helix-turn-helix domain-containing protein n=1 Tax=Nitrosococcus halophilus (strain Nc4) TaxID=472759 RepID=D5BYG2_NITHN|nr:helix-turn-helix domain-containing protein [Nitrosococcus halophilus]ADE14145.1 conserved hypothetical protein [Nitrosococcus halophilus Nc 4]
MKTPLDISIEILGSQAALAREVGVTLQAVNQWVKKGRVPPGRAIAIEQATKRRVTRYELRPDIFGEKESAAA